MKIIAILILVLLNSETQSLAFKIKLEFPNNDKIFEANLCDGIDFHKLAAKVKKENINSIEELLLSFQKDKSYSNFLNQYVLMFYSNSFEKDDISIENPRVIMHHDALITSFTGRIKNKDGQVKDVHGNSLVMFEYDAKKFEFKPRQILFDGAGHSILNNPRGCNECHGDPERPLWEDYENLIGVWVGAFDFNDSTQNPITNYVIKRFFENLKPESRYAMLVKDHYVKGNKSTNRLSNTPSIMLTKHLYHMNFHRILGKLKNLKNYVSLKPALAAAYKKCYSEMEKIFVPPKSLDFDDYYDSLFDQRDNRKAYLKQVYQESLSKVQIKDAEKPEFQAIFPLNDMYFYFGYVLQDSDFPLEQWSLNFTPKRPEEAIYYFNAGSRNLEDSSFSGDAGNLLSEHLARELRDLLQYSCGELLEMSK